MQSSARRALTCGALAFSAVLTLSPRAAHAQANYKLAPVGGRTTLVGGTGLAFGRDSASAFLNPATVVRLDSGRLAFSVNFYQLSVLTASNWYQPGAVDKRFGDISKDGAHVTTAGFDTLPGSLCLFLRVGEIKALDRELSREMTESRARLGICLASTQNDDFSLNLDDYQHDTSKGNTRQSQTVRQTFRRIAVGPTYGMYITNALAVGASLHVSRAGFRSIFESTATTYAGNAQPIASSYFNSAHGDSYDMSFTAGATYRIGRFQTVAIAFEAPSLHAFGTGGINRDTHFEGSGDGTSALTAKGDFAAYTPLRIAIGTGIERQWGSAELNVSYHLPTGPAYRASFDGRLVDTHGNVTNDQASSLDMTVRPRGVVNIGIGGEVFVAPPAISVLGGISTDLSAAPEGTLTSDPLSYYPAHENRIATSFGLGSHGTGGDLLIGGELAYGWGERIAVNSYQLPPRLDTTSSSSYSLLIVIAGTTSFQAIKRAVTDLTEVVDPSSQTNKQKKIDAAKPESQKPAPVKKDPDLQFKQTP